MPVQTQNVFRFADFEVREQELRATRSGQSLSIEPKAFRVLLYLLHHAGHLVPKEELFKAVWGDTAVTDNSLTRAIALLRRVLEDDPHQPQFIETVATAGYRFICPVETAGAPPDQAVGDASSTSSVERTDGALSLPSEAGPAGVSRARRRLWFAGSLSAVIFLAGLGSIWYFRRPLSPPRVSQIKQLTNDVRWMRKIPVGTDGNRVYLDLQSFYSSFSFAQAPIGGGEISTIPIDLKGGNGFRGADISPDGSNALLWNGPDEGVASAWLAGTSGSPVRYLTDVVSAAWWPDGKQVLFLTPAGELRLIPVSGGDSRLLARVQPGAEHFSVSPDGKRIRFDYDWKLWELPVGGTKLEELLPHMRGSVQRCCGRWSPDGAFYTFLSAKSPTSSPLRGGFQVWLLDERRKGAWGTKAEPVQLTFDPLQWISPVFSKDATMIFAGGALYQGELMRYNQKTGHFERYLNGISVEWVEFSRDGRFVAYATFPDHKIWRANGDGSGSVQLAQAEGTPTAIHWSPDGRQIIFSEYFVFSPSQTGRGRVYVVPSDGSGNPVEIPLDGTQSSGPEATWSADGKRLAFTANPANRPGETEIRVYNLETHTSSSLPRSPKPLFSPRWSPDGRYIFCLSLPESEIEIFDVALNQWRLIPRSASFPTWSRDSRFVTFVDFVEGIGGFYRMTIPSGEIERVASFKDVRTTGSINHLWFGTDADNAPLLLRDAGTFEIYALTLERK